MKPHHSFLTLRGCFTAILLFGFLSSSHGEDKGITTGTCPNPVSEATLFAFDDYGIPWKHNLKLTLVQPQKYPGNPVLRSGPEDAPDHGHAVLYGTVLKENGKFRMWYLGMIESETKHGQAPGFWRPMCYAESNDGIHWTKPDLGLVELNGNKHNNICLVQGEPFSIARVDDFLSILEDPADPDPSRRYKAAYIAHMPYEDIKGGMSAVGIKEKRIGATVCAVSPDGLSWKVLADRPANAGNERFEVSSLYRFGNFYYTTGQLISPWAWRADGSKIGRNMLAYRSPDFVNWSEAKAMSFARPGQLAEPPVPGQQTHMGAGLWNRGNVLVGLYGMWQDAEAPPPKGASGLTGVHIDLGLIVSNDGIHFREPVPGFKVLARGGEGEWDNVALLQGHAFVNEGDQTMIWYSHWNTAGALKNMDIGLATMRRDGFGYLSCMSDNSDAEFVTAPVIAAKGGKLLINVDGASNEVPLTVELLDDHDRPVPGYSGADAAKISTNGTRLAVAWPKKSAALPAGQSLAVKVRFPIKSTTKVYALYITE
jgi:hypothetical protein